MASVWIENEKNYNKQDCELKACYRLLKKLRKLYPQLPMCILLDGLYAGQPMFNKLKEQGMEWIIVFKEGAMPEAYKWIMTISDEYNHRKVLVQCEEKEIGVRQRRCHEDKFIREKPKYQKRKIIKEKTYTWINDAEHWDGERKFNIITCKEVEDKKINCDYVWLVSDKLKGSEDTIKELTERGRCRWKIENEGINMKKNGGYNLEHLYSRDEISMKIWHAIIDIAHLINQLIEKGSLVTMKAFGSIKNIANMMFEHFRYYVFRKHAHPLRIQIRLTWDSS